MDLDAYRTRASEFLEKVQAERYRHLAGLKDTLSVEPIYHEFQDLWTEAAVAELKRRRETASPDEEKRLRFLLGFAVQQAINEDSAKEDQTLANITSQEKLTVDGQAMAFHEATVLLANETDRKLRQEIHTKRLEILGQGNRHRLGRLLKFQETAERLMGQPYIALYQQLTRVNFNVLKTQLENFLIASESYYSSHLERYAQKQLGVRTEDIQPWDVHYLFRGHPFDDLFPQDKMLSVLKRTLMGLGFDLKKLENIVIDSVERPSKSTFPACIPVRVPQEVYLVLRPQGGMPDFLALLEKTGLALHAGNISGTEPFEYRHLGDRAVSETFGFLFQYLTLNRDWLQDYVKIDYDHEFRDFNQFRKLYLLRSEAARFLFELELYSSPDPQSAVLPDRFTAQIQTALHLPSPGVLYMTQSDEPFIGTNRLRAWIFESEMREILHQKYGHRWYSRPIAGDFLKEVWSHGFRYDCDEMAQRVRNWGLSMDPITRELS